MPNQGRLVCQAKCSVCGSKNWLLVDSKPKFFRCRDCSEGLSLRAWIVIYYGGKKVWIGSDKQGRPFPTPDHAEMELQVIRQAIEHKTFFLEDYRGTKGSALLWQNWLAAHEKRMEIRLRTATLRKYRSMWGHLRGAFAGMSIKDVRKGHIADFLDSLADISPKYKSDILGEIKRLFRDALDREDIERLPGLPHVKVPGQADPVPEPGPTGSGPGPDRAEAPGRLPITGHPRDPPGRGLRIVLGLGRL